MSNKDNVDNKNNKNNKNKDIQDILTLKVAEVAEQRDVGRKIVRIDPDGAEYFNISTGDALELSSLGKKKAVVLN